jgi:SAM-dependent methyltransferase
MKHAKQDQEKIAEKYSMRYEEFGYSPKSLFWNKGKQNLRFNILTSQFELEGKSILDIGCGFGDLTQFLEQKTTNYSYFGIDITKAFIIEANKRFANEKIHFKHGDFLNENIEENFDIAIASGTFNIKFENEDNYTFVESVIKKALSFCEIGIAFDFISDKVDFRDSQTFYYAPERVLSIAYKYSRNIIVRNDYMPFEFALFVFKDDSFEKEDTIFKLYKNKCHYDFDM